MPPDVGVVIAAAGRGERVGAGLLKQFRPIGGVPMLLRSIRVFREHPEVAAIAVALPEEHVTQPPPFLASLADQHLRLVTGGPTRAESVARAVAALPEGVSVILVHDAARPFVARETIDRVIVAARAGRGAIPAVPVTDALKRWSGRDASVHSVDRTDLWRAQTPQGFPAARFRDLCRAPTGSAAAPLPDDAARWEQAGEPLVIVEDRTTNFKVTSADDLALAEAMTSAQQ